MVQPGPAITTGGPGPGSGSALALFCPINAASVGAAYTSFVTATGGTPPYNFTITGVLPAGLTLNAATGAVTGTPTTAGPDTFTAAVTDSAPRLRQPKLQHHHYGCACNAPCGTNSVVVASGSDRACLYRAALRIERGGSRDCSGEVE